MKILPGEGWTTAPVKRRSGYRETIEPFGWKREAGAKALGGQTGKTPITSGKGFQVSSKVCGGLLKVHETRGQETAGKRKMGKRTSYPEPTTERFMQQQDANSPRVQPPETKRKREIHRRASAL